MSMSDRNRLIVQYFDSGLTYHDIAFTLTSVHQLSVSTRHIKRILRTLGLHRRQYSSLEDSVAVIRDELAGSGELHGYRMMQVKCANLGIHIRRDDVRLILKELDPDAVERRMRRCLVRREYSAKGPNWVWHVDGYDKLKPFGLCINGCICGFSRKIVWLNVYHTNNNPKVIGGYYLEAVSDLAGCPKIVRTDDGTENGLIRQFQLFFHRSSNDSYPPYISGASTANQRIEGWWSVLYKQCAEYWISMFKVLRSNGLHDGTFLDMTLTQFCFTAVLQVNLVQRRPTRYPSNMIMQCKLQFEILVRSTPKCVTFNCPSVRLSTNFFQLH